MRPPTDRPSRTEQAGINLTEARELRAAGVSYREIRRRLALTPAQLALIRRTLKREKASATRLRRTSPDATARDLPISRSALPIGLRKRLAEAGYVTLGDLADRLADRDSAGLETLGGIGPHRARLITQLLDQYDLLPGPDDLRAAIEAIFPELGEDR